MARNHCWSLLTLLAVSSSVLLAACAANPPAPTAAAAATTAAQAAASTGAVTAADLQLPASAYPDVTEVVVRALGVDDPSIPDETATPEIRALRLSGQLSAANYRFRIGGERPGQIKVRIDVFRDAATAAERFRGRHLPEALALTQPLDAGEDGYIFEDQYAGFRVGPVVVELHAAEARGHIAEFARVYAGHVRERLAAAQASVPAPGTRP